MLILRLINKWLPRVIVCGEVKSELKAIESPSPAVATASRREQSALHTPSFVSAVFVTMRVKVGATSSCDATTDRFQLTPQTMADMITVDIDKR
jgi:hypothetical protein